MDPGRGVSEPLAVDHEKQVGLAAVLVWILTRGGGRKLHGHGMALPIEGRKKIKLWFEAEEGGERGKKGKGWKRNKLE